MDSILLKISGTKPLLSAGERKKEKNFQKIFGDITKGSTFAVPIHAHNCRMGKFIEAFGRTEKKVKKFFRKCCRNKKSI